MVTSVSTKTSKEKSRYTLHISFLLDLFNSGFVLSAHARFKYLILIRQENNRQSRVIVLLCRPVFILIGRSDADRVQMPT